MTSETGQQTHTPGPLTSDEQRITTDHGTCLFTATLRHDGYYCVADVHNAADGRRFAAVWNAFLNVPTDIVEARGALAVEPEEHLLALIKAVRDYLAIYGFGQRAHARTEDIRAALVPFEAKP